MIARIALLVELALIVTEDEQARGAFQGIWATGEAARAATETGQVVTQISVGGATGNDG
jgi:hypothetical protein